MYSIEIVLRKVEDHNDLVSLLEDTINRATRLEET